jgi:hypothetical protein
MHQQFPRRAPSAATFRRSAQVTTNMQVAPRIITHWAHAGRIPYQGTLGRHCHSPADVIHQLVASPRVEVCDG